MKEMEADLSIPTSSSHYLSSLPPPISLPTSQILKDEYEKIAANNGTPAPPPANSSFHPSKWAEPPSKALSNDVQAWKVRQDVLYSAVYDKPTHPHSSPRSSPQLAVEQIKAKVRLVEELERSDSSILYFS